MGKINLKGTQKEIVDIEIDLQDAFSGVETALQSKYGIGQNQWIDDEGWICEWAGHYHNDHERRVRKATPQQKRLAKALHAVNEFIQKDPK